METSYLGAYWGDRRETAGECGARLARCIQLIGAVDPVLASWYLLGASKAAARTPVATDSVSLERLFLAGQNRRDFGGTPIVELGYSVGMWNRAKPAVGLSALCGAHPGHPGILNSFVLNFPAPADGAENLYRVDAARAIFDAAVAAWQPEWATWGSHSWAEDQSPRPREPVVGWLTYLKGTVVPAVTYSTRRLSEGFVMETASDFASVTAATVRAAREQLEQNALLRPIP